MGITKSILAEQVQRLLGESEASRFDLREIMLAVGQARDFRIRMDYFESSAAERHIPHEYLSVYPGQAVQRDTAGKEYVDLPASYLRLPKGRGIFAIYPDGKEQMPFVQSEAGVGAMLQHHPAFRTGGRPAYAPEGNRCKFRREISKTYPRLTVVLIRPSESFGDTEELPIPADMQLQIVQDALNLLRIKPAPDKVNDNADVA